MTDSSVFPSPPQPTLASPDASPKKKGLLGGKKKKKGDTGPLAAGPAAVKVAQYSPATKKLWLFAFLVLIGGAVLAYTYLDRTAEKAAETHCVAVAAVNMARGGLLSEFDPNSSPISFVHREVDTIEPGVMTHPVCETLALAMVGIEAPPEWLAEQPEATDTSWQVFGTAPLINIYAGQQIRRAWFGTPAQAYLIGLAPGESVVRLTVPPANALLGAFQVGDRVDVVMPDYSGADALLTEGSGQAVIIARDLEIVHTTVDPSVFDEIQSQQVAAAAAGGSYSIAGRLPIDAVPTTYVLKADSTTSLSLINASVSGSLYLTPASDGDALTVATAITALCLDQNSPLEECASDPGVVEYQARQNAVRNRG